MTDSSSAWTQTAAAQPAENSPAPQRLDDLTDLLSPILIKEVRQMVRGREFNYSFGLSLVIGLIVAFLGGMEALAGTVGTGSGIFIGLMSCLTLIGLVVVPLGTLNALRIERSEQTLDLISLTTLSPRRIVIGKLLGQAVKLVTLFAGLAPFIATSFLLGGIDFFTILLSLASLFLWSMWACAAALFLSSLTKSRALSIVVSAGAALVFLVVAGAGRAIYYAMLYGGFAPVFGASSPSSTYWWFWGSVAVCLITMMNLVLLAENRLSSPMTDRVTPLRIGLLVQLLLIVTLVLLSAGSGRAAIGRASDEVTTLGILAGLQLAAVAIFTISENLGAPRRLRLRKHAVTPLYLLIAIFRPGAGRGAAYVLVQIAIVLATGSMLSNSPSDLHWLVAICGYICFFTGVPAFLARWLAPRRMATPHIRVAMILFFPVLALLAEVFSYVLSSSSTPQGLSGYDVLSPFRALSYWVTVEMNGWDSGVYALGFIGLLSYIGLAYLAGQYRDDNAAY